MIVVVASPRSRRLREGRVMAAGLGTQIALCAAAAGASVQVVGRVGEDPAGEGVLLDLAQRSVGHIAVLRDAGHATREEQDPPDIRATRDIDAAFDDGLDAAARPVATPNDAPSIDAADLQLALSYLPDYRVVVVAEPLESETLRVAANAVGWAGSSLVVVGRAGDFEGLPEDATVFAPPDGGDPDGAFATMVGTYAAGLDRGDDPKAAFAAASAAVGSTAAE